MASALVGVLAIPIPAPRTAATALTNAVPALMATSTATAALDASMSSPAAMTA